MYKKSTSRKEQRSSASILIWRLEFRAQKRFKFNSFYNFMHVKCCSKEIHYEPCLSYLKYAWNVSRILENPSHMFSMHGGCLYFRMSLTSGNKLFLQKQTFAARMSVMLENSFSVSISFRMFTDWRFFKHARNNCKGKKMAFGKDVVAWRKGKQSAHKQ